jgi:putative peptide maturation system protein
MTAVPAPLLADALEYLTGLDRDGADPATASERLAGLRRRYPETRIRLVWQREEYDGTLHYDLLLAGPGRGTTSLAYCPDRALPWPLIGGQWAGDRVLLRVDGVAVEIDEVIAQLHVLRDDPVADRLVAGSVIRQELAAEPVTLTAAELQEAMDAFRRARGLLTAADTERWLSRRGLTHPELERQVAAEAAVERLRVRIVAGRVEQYFAQHRRQLDAVRLWRVSFAAAVAAGNALAEITAGAGTLQVLEEAYARGVDVTLPGRLAVVRRDELTDAQAAAVFDAVPGATLGPFEAGDRYEILRVLAHRPATLDQATERLIERRLFTEWLDRRVAGARVEWFWRGGSR